MKKKNPSEETDDRKNDIVTRQEVDHSLVSTKRKVGIVAIAYAISMIAQNGMFAVTGAPGYNEPLSVVLSYHADNQGALSITSGLETLNMVLLILFITSLHTLVKRRGGLGAEWSQLAIVSGSTLSALFALTIATHNAIILAANRTTELNIAFEIMWQFHAATFALAMPALGLTFIGTVLASHANGLIRPYQQLLGLAGGTLPILAGFGNLAISDGSPFIYLGVLGLFIWLFWLIGMALKLIRD